MSKTFKVTGHRNPTPVVEVDGMPLPLGPSQAIHNHSPDGFNWGYGFDA